MPRRSPAGRARWHGSCSGRAWGHHRAPSRGRPDARHRPGTVRVRAVRERRVRPERTSGPARRRTSYESPFGEPGATSRELRVWGPGERLATELLEITHRAGAGPLPRQADQRRGLRRRATSPLRGRPGGRRRAQGGGQAGAAKLGRALGDTVAPGVGDLGQRAGSWLGGRLELGPADRGAVGRGPPSTRRRAAFVRFARRDRAAGRAGAAGNAAAAAAQAGRGRRRPQRTCPDWCGAQGAAGGRRGTTAAGCAAATDIILLDDDALSRQQTGTPDVRGCEIPRDELRVTGEAESSGSGETYESEAETLEAELAQELLEITTEEELDQFLGKLASSVMQGASKFVKLADRQGAGRRAQERRQDGVAGCRRSARLDGAAGCGHRDRLEAGLARGRSARGRGSRADGRGRGRVGGREPLCPLRPRGATPMPRGRRGTCRRAQPCVRPRISRRPPVRAQPARIGPAAVAVAFAPQVVRRRPAAPVRAVRRAGAVVRRRRRLRRGGYGDEPDQWWQGDDYSSRRGEGEAQGRPSAAAVRASPGAGSAAAAASSSWVPEA